VPRKPTLRLEDLDYHRWLDGKHYVCITYKDKNGKTRQKHKRVDTVEQAIRTIDELRRQYDESGPAAWDGASMKWEVLIDEYKKAHPKVKPWYLTALDWFNGRKIRSITYMTCRNFRESREGVVKRYTETEIRTVTTVNREMEELRSVLLFGCRHGWLLRNPMLDGPSLIYKDQEDRRTVVPTPEEEARILAVCVEPREHLRLYIIGTRDSGLRLSALLKIEWRMIDWNARLVRVPPNNNRYKRRPKIIGLTDRFYHELRLKYDQICREKKEPPAPTDKVYPYKGIKRAYEKACELAKIEGIWFNDFRHGFATDMMEAGVPRDMAMTAAGHSTQEAHAIYTNVDERIASMIASKLNDLHRQRSEGQEPESSLIQ
jgi:integrase